MHIQNCWNVFCWEDSKEAFSMSSNAFMFSCGGELKILAKSTMVLCPGAEKTTRQQDIIGKENRVICLAANVGNIKGNTKTRAVQCQVVYC